MVEEKYTADGGRYFTAIYVETDLVHGDEIAVGFAEIFYFDY